MFDRKTKKTDKKQAGFSLMEVMVAILIILVGLMSVLALVGASLSAGRASTSKLIASNLAQEGIEVVRNIRDASTDWSSWYSGGVKCYALQYNDVNLINEINCSADAPVLKYHPSIGLYNYVPGGDALDTPYKRKIIITLAPNGDSNEVSVTAEIIWSDKSASYSIVAEDRLWNWK